MGHLDEACLILGVERSRAVSLAVVMLVVAARGKAEGKALGLTDDPETLALHIVGF